MAEDVSPATATAETAEAAWPATAAMTAAMPAALIVPSGNEPMEPPAACAEGSQPNITLPFSREEEAFFAQGEELSARYARERDELARRIAEGTLKQSRWQRWLGRSSELAFD